MRDYQQVAIAIAVTLFFSLHALFWISVGRKRRREDRLRARLRLGETGPALTRPRRSLGALNESLLKLPFFARLDERIVHAGLSVSVVGFVGRLLAAVAFVGVVVTLLTGNSGSGMLFGLITAVALYWGLSRRRSKRLHAVDVQLPRALELMMFGLKAGHSLEDSIRFAAKEIDAPLAIELGRCHEEYELGRPIEEALINLWQRLRPCRALRTFVEGALVLKQAGGNMVEIIERIVESMRAQSSYEARHRALTSEGRTSGMILGALPLVILGAVALAQPGYLGQLFLDATGWKVIALAGGLWAVGIVWLMRLVRPAN